MSQSLNVDRMNGLAQFLNAAFEIYANLITYELFSMILFFGVNYYPLILYAYMILLSWRCIYMQMILYICICVDLHPCVYICIYWCPHPHLRLYIFIFSSFSPVA